jgi:hypothetical protein
MAKPSFVGYQEKVEIPEGFELLTIQEEIDTSLNRDQLFSLLSEAEQISQWFYQIKSFDSHQGKKIVFIDDQGLTTDAVCTSFVLGKEVSMLADIFGNFTGEIIKKGKSFSLKVTFKILTDNPDEKSARAQNSIARLKVLLS